VISYKVAPFTAAVIKCDAAVGQLLEKTLDEMLELESGEDVGDLIQGGAHNSCGDQL
jgi:hypothetical protein